jgi:hypothetical protein
MDDNSLPVRVLHPTPTAPVFWNQALYSHSNYQHSVSANGSLDSQTTINSGNSWTLGRFYQIDGPSNPTTCKELIPHLLPLSGNLFKNLTDRT